MNESDEVKLSGTPVRQETILCIDDLEDNLMMMAALVKKQFPGLRVITAESGKEGYLAAQKEKPDLILLDIVMPGMDGFQVCRLLKSNSETAQIPVIMITGMKTNSMVKIDALNSGADSFLLKPFDQAELTATINAMLRLKHAEDQLRKEKETLRELIGAQSRKMKDNTNRIRQYEDIIDHMQLGLNIFYMEDMGDNKSFRMVGANPASCNILGRNEADMVGKLLAENLPGWNIEEISRIYGDVIRTGKPVRMEDVKYDEAEGENRHFLVRAFPLPFRHLGVLFEDITRQKEVELALMESEAKFRLLFENMMDAFVIFELIYTENNLPVDFRFLNINPPFEKIVRKTRETIIGKNASEVFPGLETFWFDHLDQVIKFGKPSRFRRFINGLDRHFEVVAFHLKDREFAAFFRDVTEEIVHEEAMKRSIQEKELLMRDIHHRIKNNLSMISSLLNMQSRCLDDEKARTAFKQSRKRIQAIALLHERLYQSADMSAIEFGRYIREVVKMLSESVYIPAGTADITVDVEEIILETDIAVPLGLIVTELVTNALKYGAREDRQMNVKVLMNFCRESEICRLSVADNGPGLPPDLNWRNSSTLGLQLVVMLTEQLGGSIRLENGDGSTFTISFPIRKDKNINPSPQSGGN